MREIEREISQPTVKILLNKVDGRLCLDDEVLPTTAKDVEQKMVCERKRAGEGTHADTMANSNDGKLYAMSLRRPGEPEKNQC